ncbi:hypothetical protein ACJJTC_011866 [Scirpophaga incertulas]
MTAKDRILGQNSAARAKIEIRQAALSADSAPASKFALIKCGRPRLDRCTPNLKTPQTDLDTEVPLIEAETLKFVYHKSDTADQASVICNNDSGSDNGAFGDKLTADNGVAPRHEDERIALRKELESMFNVTIGQARLYSSTTSHKEILMERVFHWSAH